MTGPQRDIELGGREWDGSQTSLPRCGKRGEVALVPFIMAGDPDLDATRALVRAAADAGADLIELGVPFSDPTADGPVIQRAGVRALQRGTSLRQILEMVAELRAGGLETPIVLFGYYNPIFHYGPERLAQDAARAGVDGCWSSTCRPRRPTSCGSRRARPGSTSSSCSRRPATSSASAPCCARRAASSTSSR